MTTLSQHVDAWSDCTTCDLNANRCNVVLHKGELPCDVLFLGPAPNTADDVIGTPFVGADGSLLDDLCQFASNETSLTPAVAYTHVVACIPYVINDLGGLDKARPPRRGEISACQPRLYKYLDLAKPKRIIAVGAPATMAARKQFDIVHASIEHPTAIRNKNPQEYDAAWNRAALAIKSVYESLR